MNILAGAAVGLAVGLTGVGGGSLMTPLLLAFGFPLHIAVGTDLLFAAVTKAGGVVSHARLGSIRWNLVLRLAAGSLPASVLTIGVLRIAFDSPDQYAGLITTTLGLTLILTSAAIIFRTKLAALGDAAFASSEQTATALLPVLGVVLGVLVTLSSVGAGAIATAMLLIAYPALKSLNVVGTDIAHAVPLTLFAGLGHLYLGNVDFMLLAALLIGSMPAVSLGSRLGQYVPDRIMRPVLATTLCGIGIKFAFF
ncbi:MAG: sulfite exporter TauE/SafE family protein [Gammaproteobacteria bacterium]|nr:sulfite exporter TauE/SafE family protein [Gammaproteobacteria bacterium]